MIRGAAKDKYEQATLEDDAEQAKEAIHDDKKT